MKKILLGVITVLALAGCEPIKGTETKTTEGNVKVEKLFTVDGITVYRFYDCGDAVYFTSRPGKVTRIHHTDDGVDKVQTVCE